MSDHSTSPRASEAPAPPALEFAFQARVELAEPMDVGQLPHGRRRIIPIVGGTFAGPCLSGRVLNNGADWQLVRSDGLAEIDTRYALQTEAGEIIYLRNAGVRHAPADVLQKISAGESVDPSLVYFRTVATFETAATSLQWLTRSVFVGSGERHPTHVIMRFWRLT